MTPALWLVLALVVVVAAIVIFANVWDRYRPRLGDDAEREDGDGVT